MVSGAAQRCSVAHAADLVLAGCSFCVGGRRWAKDTKDLSRLGDRESGGVGFFECDEAAGELE